jgi:hypothetical protein
VLDFFKKSTILQKTVAKYASNKTTTDFEIVLIMKVQPVEVVPFCFVPVYQQVGNTSFFGYKNEFYWGEKRSD